MNSATLIYTSNFNWYDMSCMISKQIDKVYNEVEIGAKYNYLII